jgi:hypothetical protein
MVLSVDGIYRPSVKLLKTYKKNQKYPNRFMKEVKHLTNQHAAATP